MAIAIFLLVLVLVILQLSLQPQRHRIGMTAIAGAILALFAGVVTWQDLLAVGGLISNALLTVTALTLISLILDKAGLFRTSALHIARWGFGRGRLLFLLIVLLGAAIAALLTNYATALIWTPIVIELLLLLKLRPITALAFTFITNFIADAASLAFPVSNLVNLISVDYFNISFLRYSLVMVPVNAIAIIASLGVLWFYFDRYLPKTYRLTPLPHPDLAVRDSLICRWGFTILGLLLLSYFLLEPLSLRLSTPFLPTPNLTLSLPVGVIASMGALVLLALAGRWFQPQATVVISLPQVWREIPWQEILFSLGIYILVIGVQKALLSLPLSQLLEGLSHWGLTFAITGTGFLAALFSATINNLPAILINALAIQNTTGIDPAMREAMVYANVIGCNIGAKITPLGSLSTLLWLNVLIRKGLFMTWGEYLRLSIFLTLPVLFITLLGLAIWLPWLIA
ncbi:MAG: arsenical efflux pump membrane protein ArsB [Kastovskya adunca ATA6-11-RM4]|nr:arsenical efflux pump membrane protein ArsB [Kastovskya adunca ATA6-11-RM4]